MNPCIILENLTLSYERHPAVHHISGEFACGSLTAVTGPNGAGKSTLLKAIAGMMSPQEGRIILHGLDKKDIAYLPQITDIRSDFPISVAQMVASGLWNKGGGFAAIGAESRQRIRDALAAVGLDGFSNRELATLSLGQLQRALFARLIVQDAQLILLDEPFNTIDEDTTKKLLEIMRQWHQEGRTIICIIHDTEMIHRHFPHCLLIARECIAWNHTASTLSQDNLERSRHFREAWQPHSEICQQ